MFWKQNSPKSFPKKVDYLITSGSYVTNMFLWELPHLQTGEQISQFDEERKENEAYETSLRRRFGHFVSIHERGDRETFQLLHVTLDKYFSLLFKMKFELYRSQHDTGRGLIIIQSA